MDPRGAQRHGGGGMITVCLHGAESTGKSVLAAQLAERFGAVWVPEYGRTYCEEKGTDLTMADLLAIAEGQAMANQAARPARPSLVARPRLVILDTDQLMTAAWAEMLFGTVPDALMAYPKADHYLLFAADVPWVDDGTRFFGKGPLRTRFAALAEEMLERAAVPFTRISGDWNAREAGAVAALQALLAVTM